MNSAPLSSDTPRPLPQLPGPKFAPFTATGYADIEFIHELGDPNHDMDSFVWKVRIDGMIYALKMFRINSHLHLRRTVGSHLSRPLKTPQLYIDYFDPFNCECRVYGRLHQEHCEDLAIDAHGYLMLTPEQEKEVARRTGPNDHYDPDPDIDNDLFGRCLEPLVRDRPIHAIVKEFATWSEREFGPKDVDQMCRDLNSLHRLGILVRDITLSNYIDGKLIDFSRAWTMPHPSLDRISEERLREQRYSDPHDLQDCIFDLRLGDYVHDELVARLLETSENDGCGTDPRRYDWRKWEADLEAVDAFMENDLYGPPFD